MCQELGPAPRSDCRPQIHQRCVIGHFHLEKGPDSDGVKEEFTSERNISTLRGDKTHNQPLLVTAEINADHYD